MISRFRKKTIARCLVHLLPLVIFFCSNIYGMKIEDYQKSILDNFKLKSNIAIQNYIRYDLKYPVDNPLRLPEKIKKLNDASIAASKKEDDEIVVQENYLHHEIELRYRKIQETLNEACVAKTCTRRLLRDEYKLG